MRVKKILLIISALGLLSSISSCAVAAVGAAAGSGVAVGTDTRGGGGVIDDQELEHRVNNALSAEVPKGSFTVASFNQKILLAGRVPTTADKIKAERAVNNTVGTKGLWDYLTVGPNESITDVTKDAYLTSSAKTRLIAQKGVNANNVKVVTANGVVYLLGHDAGKSYQIRGAINGISHIDGVKRVVNLIR